MNSLQDVDSRPSVGWVAVFSTLAFGMALAGSLLRPVWHDELYTLSLARMPLAGLLAALRVDSGPPLHYLVSHVLFAVVGWPEGSALGTFMVRLPSVLAYTVMPWVLWRWAQGRGRAFFWAALLTIAWLPMLYFATEARAYALLALVNATLWLVGPRLVASGGSRLVLFAALAAALPMLHYAGVVSFCLLPALTFFIPASRRRSLLIALGAAALPLAIWFPIATAAPAESMSWVDVSTGPGRPGLVTVQALAPAGPFPALFEAPMLGASRALSMAALLILAVGCAAGAVRRWRTGVNEWRSVISQTFGLLPVAALGALSVVGVPVYFAGRTESIVWPLLICLVVVLLGSLSPMWRMLAVVPYVALGLGTVGMWLAGLPSSPPPVGVEVGRAIAPELRQNDLIVVIGLWQLEVEHGLAEAALGAVAVDQAPTRVRTLPRSQCGHPGWLDRVAAMSPAVFDDARALERESRREERRIWLVSSPALRPEQSVFPAFSGWRRSAVLESPLIAVDLLLPPPGAGDIE